jgi:hypothetical protein
MSQTISTPNRRKASALDADVPRTGRAADAYEVACTAATLARGIYPARPDAGIFAPARHAVTLHRISGHLHRLAERACNEDLTCPDCGGEGKAGGQFKADDCRACAGHGTTVGRRLERLQADARQIAEHYGLQVYFQTDPRGCSLYLIDPAIVPGDLTTLDALMYESERTTQNFPSATKLQARWIDSHYDRGHAVVRLGA